MRYFSPLAEVPFCGHATIATGVALGERALAASASPDGPAGEIVLATNGGPVAVSFERGADGHVRATLTSVATWVREPGPELVARALELLGWQGSELDPGLPPAIGFAGAKHLILVARDASRLSGLDYPFEALKALMLDADLTTLQLVWREAPDRFRARDPFPVGGVVEDPATGAAAAALGAYLRERGEIVAPASFEISQGVEMGRPSRITVSIAPGEDGVRVLGHGRPDLTAPEPTRRWPCRSARGGGRLRREGQPQRRHLGAEAGQLRLDRGGRDRCRASGAGPRVAGAAVRTPSPRSTGGTRTLARMLASAPMIPTPANMTITPVKRPSMVIGYLSP